MEIEPLISLADQALSEKEGRSAGLEYVETVGQSFKSIVIRCRVSNPSDSLPATVIVKHTLDIPQLGKDAALFNLLADWAALEFFQSVQGEHPHPPILFAGDKAARLLVMEDLGEGELGESGDPMNGNDPELAEEAMVEGAAQIGRLHAATMGLADHYERIRKALGPMPTDGELYRDPWPVARRRRSKDLEVQGAIDRYNEICRSVGLAPANGFAEEMEHITRVVEEEPGPWLAFCSGDQHVPGPVFKKNGEPRLFDFDCAGFRHALIEGMPARMTWGCYMRIPQRLVPVMDRIYQAQLAESRPEVADDAVYHKGMAEAGARCHIFHVIHRLPDALEKDRMRGPSTIRQQVIAWLDSFAGLSDEFGHLPALGGSSRDLAARLRQMWSPEACELPSYPAFRSCSG